MSVAHTLCGDPGRFGQVDLRTVEPPAVDGPAVTAFPVRVWRRGVRARDSRSRVREHSEIQGGSSHGTTG